VNFLTKIIGLKPGPELHKKLARVLGGEDEGADIVDEEKARQLASPKCCESPGRIIVNFLTSNTLFTSYVQLL